MSDIIIKSLVLPSLLVGVVGLSACNSGTSSSNNNAPNESIPVTTVALPQTGQVMQVPTGCTSSFSCWTSTLGTDGYGKLVGSDNIPYGVAWAYNGSSQLMPANRFTIDPAESDCIIDNLTGLEWPKNGSIGFESEMFGSPIIQPDYSNTDPDLNKLTWADGMVAVKNMNIAPVKLCGYDDWRMPNVNEMASLLNYGVTSTKIWLNSQGFMNVDSDYWSSTSRASSPSLVKWSISLGRYPSISYSQSMDEPFTGLFPVRSTPLTISAPAKVPQTGQTVSQESGDDGALQNGAEWVDSSNRFVVGKGGESDCITDQLTGLMWVRDLNSIPIKGSPYPRSTSWQNAIDSANAVNSGFGMCDHYDWRIPNINELRSLVNYGADVPATWLNEHGFSGFRSMSYWSSTSSALSPTEFVSTVAFLEGSSDDGISKARGSQYVILVRGGQ